MKLTSSIFSLRAAFAVLLAAALAATAQEPPAAERPANPSPAPPAATAPAAPAEKQAEPPLRDIGEPSTEVTVTTTRSADGTTTTTSRRVRSNGGSQFPMGDHHVPEGSRMQDAVSILGSTWVEGEVDGDAVSVVGDTRVSSTGRVRGGVVAVVGRLDVDGEVRGDAVGVLGGVKINGRVGGQVVSVLGGLELGPKAVVDGDVVVVGGKLKKDPAAIIRGNVVNVPILGGFGDLDWLVTWFKRCFLLGRPLAFGEHLGWAWAVAFTFLAFYLLLALLFPRGIEKCVNTFETRPGYSVLASFLTVLLTPVALVLLAVTVIGAVLVPFVGIGLFAAKLFGKAVLLAWIGRRFTRLFGEGPLGHPVFAVLVGGVLVMLLYTVPVVGFMLYKVLSWLGLGVVIYTLALAMKREKPPAAPVAGAAGEVPLAETPVSPSGPPPVASTGFVAASDVMAATSVPLASAASAGASATPTSEVPVAAPTASSGFVGSDPAPMSAAAPSPSAASSAGMGATATPPPPPAPRTPAPRLAARPPITAATMPRATFMVRMAALLLDLVLVGMLVAFLNGMMPRSFRPEPPSILLMLAVYGAIMWKLRGTTIGGIVCGLKVVRLDDRPLDWATACVRALSCFLSLVVAGLGFIWIAIDDEKQSWHDKIAGTVVVRVPKGVSLL